MTILAQPTRVRRISVPFEFLAPRTDSGIIFAGVHVLVARARIHLNFQAGSLKLKMSAEPGRKRAYSVDIRWRVVYQRIGMELHFHEIANRLNIATSTAHRIYQQFARTGDVEPARRKARPELRALDEHNELLVIGIIMENPTVYLEEICKRILSITNIAVAPPTICRLATETIWHH